ncbi:MAG TPA: MraY family glycosyltransferase [Candidatus Eisenbacteria bacterium]|nr:MraY family glycosyltransferase [Candidatus Eisenbacteria bacterium]
MSSKLPLLEVAPLAFGAALVLTPLMARLAVATGFLDHPDPRKPHPAPTALLGGAAVGLAIAIGIVFAAVLFGVPVGAPRTGVLVGAALSLVLGLVDDRHAMRPAGKLLGQIAVGICLVLWGARDGFMVENPFLGAVAMLGVVALLNAINFLDAMDGIVGAVVPITASGFVAISLLHGADVDLALAWGMIGAGAGFLVYNAPPARIFLGDAGSHLLGFTLAALTLQALDDALTWPHLAGVACILAYPMFDVIFVIVDRLLLGRPITVGTTDHTTHRLGRICGRWGTLAIISGLVTVGTVLGVYVWGRVSDLLVTALLSILGLGYAIFGAALRRVSPTPSFDT